MLLLNGRGNGIEDREARLLIKTLLMHVLVRSMDVRILSEIDEALGAFLSKA